MSERPYLSPDPVSWPEPHPAYHLAQLNVAEIRAPLDSQQMEGFVSQLAPINALADAAPGFVWRLVGEGSDDATSYRPFDDDMVLVNLSVWRSLRELWEFVYRSAHLEVMRHRRQWFHRMAQPYLVLWWIPAGTIPTLPEAVARLERLRADGPGPEAFTFRALYPPPAASASPAAAPASSAG